MFFLLSFLLSPPFSPGPIRPPIRQIDGQALTLDDVRAKLHLGPPVGASDPPPRPCLVGGMRCGSVPASACYDGQRSPVNGQSVLRVLFVCVPALRSTTQRRRIENHRLERKQAGLFLWSPSSSEGCSREHRTRKNAHTPAREFACSCRARFVCGLAARMVFLLVSLTHHALAQAARRGWVWSGVVEKREGHSRAGGEKTRPRANPEATATVSSDAFRSLVKPRAPLVFPFPHSHFSDIINMPPST